MTETNETMTPLHWTRYHGAHVAHGTRHTYRIAKQYFGTGKTNFLWAVAYCPADQLPAPDSDAWTPLQLVWGGQDKGQYQARKLIDAKSHCAYHNELIIRGEA